MEKIGNLLIDEDILVAMDDYGRKTDLLQEFYFEGNKKNISLDELKLKVNDDLAFYVPIYDVTHRRYAAFSSLLEALWHGDKDVKGNGKFFTNFKRFNLGQLEWVYLFYAFRLCGSGINYKPKSGMFQEPWGTHGFGNFWIIDQIRQGVFNIEDWLKALEDRDIPFTNNKGYLLPQFTFEGMNKGHLKNFILRYSFNFVNQLLMYITRNPGLSIYEITDYGNDWLMERGFKRQNFILTAFAMDLAEYYPNLINRKSKVYAGTNATKCIKQLFKKDKKMSEFDFINEALGFLANRYGAERYDVEDSRACDPVRYFQEYQSKDHIAKNGGKVYKNNTILKQIWGDEKYYDWASKLK